MINRRTVLADMPAAAGLAATLGTGAVHAAQVQGAKSDTKVQLIRSATVKVTVGGVTFLIDPMLCAKGEWPGFAGTLNAETRNPMIDLPMSIDEVIKGVDAVVLTHIHEDHWDEAARKHVPKNLPVFVDSDVHQQEVQKVGFKDVRILEPGTVFKGVEMFPQMSQHGTDEAMASHPLGDLLGSTMGIFFKKTGCKSVYVVGDSTWQPFITTQISTLRPDVIVLNTGNAICTEFAESIIMGAPDFMRAYREAPWAKIVAVHMDAINHCVLRRYDLRQHIALHKFDSKRALVPNDGEVLTFA